MQITEKVKKEKKHKFQAPDAYIVLFALVIFAFALTFIVPAGYFNVSEESYTSGGVESTREVVDPDSFQYIVDSEGNPDYLRGMVFSNYTETDTTGVLNAMYNGFVDGGMDGTAGMIAFILIIGGSFAVVIRTGAIDAGIWTVLRRIKGREILIIPCVMIVFSLGGAVMGLAEELIPFAMIVIPLLIRIGYDSITAMLTVYCSMMVGFATTWMNPFTILVAQGIADVPLMSGAGFRIVMYCVFEALLITYTIRRAIKYKKNPELSITYDADTHNFRESAVEEGQMAGAKLGVGEITVLLALLGCFVWVFWGVLANGWYLPQMGAQFLGAAIICGTLGVIFKLNNMRINDIAGAFKQGLMDLVPVVMILALGKGITLVLGGVDNAEPSVLNTILHFGGESLSGLPAMFTAWGMYLFQSLFNFLVCSGPAQAAIAMPIMAPLSDLLGVTRQTACLAYQMGDGFTNMINPTSAVLMAYLGIAKINFGLWCKFQWKMQVALFAGGSIFMIIAVLIGYGA